MWRLGRRSERDESGRDGGRVGGEKERIRKEVKA
jgi:hypothetical protein